MAVVSSDFLTALLTEYQTRFGQTWHERAGDDALLKVAQRIDSNTLNETIPFVGAVSAGPQDVTSSVVEFNDMLQYSITIANKTWQDGFEIQREAFEDDRYKLYSSKPQELAAGHQLHIGERIGAMFELGTSTTAYDGIYFFANTRATGSTGQTNDNILAATGTYTTASNVFTDLRTGQAAMMAFTNDKGEAMGLRANTIVLPPALYDQFYSALTYNSSVDTPPAGQIAPPSDMFQVSGYTVMLNRQLTSSTAWYLLHVDAARGRFPFVWTDRETPRLEGTTATDSYEWRVLRKAQYTSYGRYEAGYGNPTLAIQFA